MSIENERLPFFYRVGLFIGWLLRIPLMKYFLIGFFVNILYGIPLYEIFVYYSTGVKVDYYFWDVWQIFLVTSIPLGYIVYKFWKFDYKKWKKGKEDKNE